LQIRKNVKRKYLPIIKHIPRIDIIDCLSKSALIKILVEIMKVINPEEVEKYWKGEEV
jgi:hypothetical protein